MGALKSAKCSKGHKMTARNLYVRANGQRQCKKCTDIRNKLYQAEEKAKRRRLRPNKKQYQKAALIGKVKARHVLRDRINAAGGAEA